MPALAKHKKHGEPPPAPLATPAPEPPALPAEAAPAIRRGAPPSESLQPFVDTHLGKILAPLGDPAFAQPEVLASMKAGYADGLASAAEPQKPAYQLAQTVCDALAGAISERQTAVTALRGALATRSSEAEQPRGGGEAIARARDKDTFFVESQKNNWVQRAAALQQNIAALYLRERGIERQAGAWPTATPVPPTGAPTTAATVAAAAPTPAPDGAEPIIGRWILDGRSPITLEADHSITGDREGFWNYTCTTNAGRNYELHWKPPKDWIDYMVLSSDAKMLDGKTRKGKRILAYRR